MALLQIIARTMSRLNANSDENHSLFLGDMDYLPYKVAYDATEQYIKWLLHNPEFQLGSVLRAPVKIEDGQLGYKLYPSEKGLSCQWIGGGKIPYGTTHLELRTKQQSIPAFPAMLRGIDIDYGFQLESLPTLPTSLQVLRVRCAPKLKKINFDAESQLKVVYLHAEALRKIGTLPAELEVLICSCCNSLQTIAELPSTLKVVSLYYSEVKHLPVLPDGLQVLDLAHCEFIGFEDLPKAFPNSLQLLNLDSHSAKFTREEVVEIKKRLPKGCFFNYNKRLL